MNKETVLIVDRDRDAAIRTAGHIRSEERLVLTGCDAAVAGLIVSRLPVASIVTDVRISGDFAFDGLDLVGDVRRSAPDCRIVVTGEELSQPLFDEARRRGASDVLLKPLDDVLLRLSLGISRRGGGGHVLHIPTLEEVLESVHLSPAFQPIVDLENPAGPHGFESLARFRDRALSFCDPMFLFEWARLRGRTADLELACLRRTLRQARSLPRDAKLFINIHPQVLRDGERLARTLVQEATDSGIEPANVVLEITEQEKVERTPATLSAVDRLREIGVQFALDDVGMSYSHLDLIDRIKPSYLKVSQEFGTDFERDPTRQKIIRNILSLAHDFDCEVVLEGVETAATSGAAANIGARYAQGFYYARPQSADAF